MVRFSLAALFALCLLSPAWTQTQPAPGAVPPRTAPAAKPAKKTTVKPKPVARPAAPASAGPCGVGVIAATQNIFTVQKIGLTVFGNAVTEVAVPWNLDDLIFARAHAAAGTTPIRRIIYAQGAFDSYYHPQGGLFRNRRQELTTVIRQITSNVRCERYLVVLRSEGQFPGTNQTITGLGIANRSAGVFNYSYLFAHVEVVVFDGRTFEIRRDPHATLDGFLHQMTNNLIKDEHLRKVDNSLFPAIAAEAGNSATLRDNALDLLTSRLDKILPVYFQQ